MLKEEQIQLEKYIDKIIKKMRQGKLSPTEVLHYLLHEYLDATIRHTPFLLPTLDNSCPDVQFAKFLITFLQAPNQVKKDSKLDGMIVRLNVFYEKINLNKPLFFLFSAFFSVYDYYRAQLSEKMLKKLFYKDIWDGYLQRQLHTILWTMLDDPNFDDKNKIFRLAACEALGRFSPWISPNLREDVVGSLFKHIESDYYKVQTILSLVALQKWIPDNKRSFIIEELFENIIIPEDLHHEEVRREACNAIIQLKEWPRSLKCYEIMNRCIDKLVARNWYVAKEACIVVEKLMEIIPVSLYSEISNYLLMNINHHHANVATHAMKALSKLPPQILAQSRLSLFDKLQLFFSSQNNLTCQVACECLGSLWGLFLLEEQMTLLSIVETLIMSSTLNIKMAAIHAISQLKFIPIWIRTSIVNRLLSIIESDREDSNVKVAAMIALGKLSYFIPIDSRTPVLRGVQNVFHDVKYVEKIKHAAYETLEQLHFVPQGIRNQLIEILYQKINNELAKINTSTFHFVSPFVFWPKGKYVGAIGDYKHNNNLETVYAMIVRSRGLLNESRRKVIATKLLQQLKSGIFDNKSMRDFYGALETYVDDMSINQKIIALCHLLPLASYEDCCHHHAKVLFVHVYASYRKDLIQSMLKRVPSEQKTYLPNDIVHYASSYVI